jgi:hypothetical protein
MGRLRIVGHGAAVVRVLVTLAVVGGCLGAAAYAAKAPSTGASGDRLTVARGGSVGVRPAPVAARPAQGSRVRIAKHPEKVSTTTTAKFAFVTRTKPARFQCRLDRAPWKRCAATATYASLVLGAHAFSVRTLTGRRHGRASSYRWTLVDPKPLSIVAHLDGLSDLYPGAPAQTLPLTVSNPNAVPIQVTAVQVSISADPAGCDGASNFELIPSSTSASSPIAIPAGGSVELPSSSASAPAIALRELPVNQDACRGVQLPLLFSGEAHG